MAHKKAGGSTSLGRDSQGQRLGVKVSDGDRVSRGGIIVRQRGTAYRPGMHVRRGNDDTLFALAPGVVRFQRRTFINFNGRKNVRTMVRVETSST